MGITNQASGLKPGVCTSTTRPSAPYEGMMIYETDTDKVLVWNGSAWYPNWNQAWGVVGYASKSTSTSVNTGQTDISGLSLTWTAVSGRMYKMSFHAIGSVDTANAYISVVITDSSNGLLQIMRGTGGSSGARFSINGFLYQTGLSGSTTRKVRVETNTGGGNLDGAAAYPQQFIIEDIGPA